MRHIPSGTPLSVRCQDLPDSGGQLTIGLNLSGSTITIQPTVLVVQPERELRWIGRLFIPGIFDGEHSFIIEPQGAEPGAFCSE